MPNEHPINGVMSRLYRRAHNYMDYHMFFVCRTRLCTSISCGQQFRTYVAGVDTIMPDGASFFYSQPQDECPECDKDNWGWQWNIDLFPQFAAYKTN